VLLCQKVDELPDQLLAELDLVGDQRGDDGLPRAERRQRPQPVQIPENLRIVGAEVIHLARKSSRRLNIIRRWRGECSSSSTTFG
jgi:hypothetical protein